MEIFDSHIFITSSLTSLLTVYFSISLFYYSSYNMGRKGRQIRNNMTTKIKEICMKLDIAPKTRLTFNNLPNQLLLFELLLFQFPPCQQTKNRNTLTKTSKWRFYHLKVNQGNLYEIDISPHNCRMTLKKPHFYFPTFPFPFFFLRYQWCCCVFSW